MGPLYSAPIADVVTLLVAGVMMASVLKKLNQMEESHNLILKSVKRRDLRVTPFQSVKKDGYAPSISPLFIANRERMTMFIERKGSLTGDNWAIFGL